MFQYAGFFLYFSKLFRVEIKLRLRRVMTATNCDATPHCIAYQGRPQWWAATVIFNDGLSLITYLSFFLVFDLHLFSLNKSSRYQ